MATAKSPRSSATRERILDAAEKLFADEGYDGASMRALAAAGGAQLALLHYHFGTKLDLYRAVWARRAEQSELQKPPGSPDDATAPLPARLRRLVEHFFAPLILMRDAEEFGPFLAIIGRETADPRQRERGLTREFLGAQTDLFLGELQALLPGLGRTEAVIGLRSMIGAAQALFFEPQSTLLLSGGEADPTNLRAARAAAVDFLVGGWLALATSDD